MRGFCGPPIGGNQVKHLGYYHTVYYRADIWMSGYYNPLPMGQSGTNPTGGVGRYTWEVGRFWFFLLPRECGVLALPGTGL